VNARRSRRHHDYDIAVVGLGGIGSATAYWAAREGASVIGFEQFGLRIAE